MLDSVRVRAALENDRAIDQLAAVEHERWAGWQQFLHDRCERRDDGSLVIPAELVSRWEKQIRTPYAELSPEEQESDREQVRRYLPTVVEVLTN
ncbi:hypothetical protein [Nocardioides sp. WS12]|uniref:hypothetical protein n=1 Tax=Nocardioides sp. WS12 TaxID=2486272 RepID=UPI0015FC4145|nr:hypothetical protein [Nocardioides sp. WS12]